MDCSALPSYTANAKCSFKDLFSFLKKHAKNRKAPPFPLSPLFTELRVLELHFPKSFFFFFLESTGKLFFLSAKRQRATNASLEPCTHFPCLLTSYCHRSVYMPFCTYSSVNCSFNHGAYLASFLACALHHNSSMGNACCGISAMHRPAVSNRTKEGEAVVEEQ